MFDRVIAHVTRSRMLAMTFLKLQLADIATTRIAFAHGAHEANPLLQPFGAWFWVPKLAVAVAITAFVLFYPRSKASVRLSPLSPLATVCMAVLVLGGVGVVINNLVVIWFAT